ncbi:hypothetical protein SAMN05216199_0012 [Pedococcus cremeus]|uniref:Cupin domain-containing protein n=1 Tax=Pedococcus cremeus TaxID=587636 RepID=A0A1H9XP69_9MICO|nr:hypothetical protein [Pedococcus cremeus]SES47968.1 hypothetical protein SAMN05216199_0012 [Pedococcus cremeus]
MPKLSKSTAALHMGIPGYLDSHGQEVGDWYVTLENTLADLDFTPFYKGAPDDLCQAHHLGYVLKGKFGIRKADGSEEIYEPGDAFVIEPGHVPLQFEGGEYVAFTPAADAREQTAVLMPNLVKYAREHDIELPADLVAQFR